MYIKERPPPLLYMSASIYIYIYTHIYTHIYIHIYICVQRRRPNGTSGLHRWVLGARLNVCRGSARAPSRRWRLLWARADNYFAAADCYFDGPTRLYIYRRAHIYMAADALLYTFWRPGAIIDILTGDLMCPRTRPYNLGHITNIWCRSDKIFSSSIKSILCRSDNILLITANAFRIFRRFSILSARSAFV